MATTTRPRDTFQSSELSRSSAEVFAAASDHPVEVTRRDGETLVLMSKQESAARDGLLQLAAQLIGAAVSADGPLADRLADQFPWMLALSDEDRAACARDIIEAARASFSTKQPHLAMAEVLAWRETATAVSAGLGGRDVDWFEDAGGHTGSDLVARP